LPGKSNYFLGSDPKKWRTDVANYAKVKYRDVYPGVDMVYYGNQDGQLEYDFVVAPGADLSAIKLEVSTGPVPPLTIAPDGGLVVKIEGGEVRFHKRPSIARRPLHRRFREPCSIPGGTVQPLKSALHRPGAQLLNLLRRH